MTSMKRWQILAVRALVALFAAVSSASLTWSDEPARPEMRVTSIDRDFRVTGDGAADVWSKAQWSELNRRPGGVHDYVVRVKMLYSSTGIYVLMDTTDRQLTADMKRDFDKLWTQDVFEFFLWPHEKWPLYFEYEISPLGRELPIIIPNFDGEFFGWRPWQYDGDRRTRKAVRVRGGAPKSGAAIEGWRAEVYVPYVLLTPLQNVPPRPGTRWRANFYRVDYDGGKTTSWDWARVGASFHDYQHFGTLVFTGPSASKATGQDR